MKRPTVLITDLDNTVYDWIGYYIPSFLAMVSVLSEATGLSPAVLKASFKRVHEQYRTSEYSFALQELDVLRDRDRGLTGADVYRKYSDAIHAFRRERKALLRLYPGVAETLSRLRMRGIKLVAATDSLRYHAVQRLKQLEIEHLFDALVSAPDHPFPNSLSPEDVRLWGREYETRIPVVIDVPLSIRKPDPRFVAPVLDLYHVAPSEVAYVGDSLRRDVVMAQRAEFLDVFAQYGSVVDPGLFRELLQITYWTDDDFAADAQLGLLDVEPTVVIQSFPEIELATASRR